MQRRRPITCAIAPWRALGSAVQREGRERARRQQASARRVGARSEGRTAQNELAVEMGEQRARAPDPSMTAVAVAAGTRHLALARADLPLDSQGLSSFAQVSSRAPEATRRTRPRGAVRVARGLKCSPWRCVQFALTGSQLTTPLHGETSALTSQPRPPSDVLPSSASCQIRVCTVRSLGQTANAHL